MTVRQPSPRHLHRLRHLLVATTLVLVAALATVLQPVAASAAGATYWVDGAAAGCTDTGTGTATAPFCTISAAVKKAVSPGDTVRVRPAVYREQVTIAASGTATDPVRLTGDAPGVVVLGTRALGTATWTATSSTAWSTPYAPASNPRQVFLDGSRMTAATSLAAMTPGSWFYDATAKLLYADLGGATPAGHDVEAGAQSYGVAVTSRQNVVVSNLETRRQNFGGVRVLSSSAVTVDQVTATGSASNGILLDTSTGVTVSGAEVSGSLSTGIRLTGTSGSTVRGSRSHDNGLHGIGLTTSTSDVIDANTTFGNVSVTPTATAVGIDVNSTSTDATVTRNVTHDNQDSGVQVYNGSARALVARNVSYANGDHGFDTLNATSATYLNNTSEGNRRDGISVEGGSTGTRLANNVLVDNGPTTSEYDLYVDAPSVSGLVADYDLGWNHDVTPVVKYNGTVYKTMAAFATATSFEAHGRGVDPRFVDVANADFRVSPGSPVTDSADSTPAGFVASDAAGQAPVDDPIVPDTGTGSPTYADRGALELVPPAGVNDYAPHAALTLSPATVAVPPSGTVTADAGSSSDIDTAGIAGYTFDFGDGTTVGPQTGSTASHSYSTPGTYTVRVTVADTQGLTDSATATETATARALQTYYVTGSSPSCSDTGPATQATPLCSISAATRTATAGDTVLIGAGSYREQVKPLTGQAGSPLVLQATTPAAVVLGSDDLSDVGGWTATSTTAWRHTFNPAAAPTQVFLDGTRLTKAASATTTTNGSWFYDPTSSSLYVDTGGSNPASGHTVSAGARNYGILLRSGSYVEVRGLTFSQQNITGLYVDQSDHITADGVSASGSGSHGVTVDGSGNVAVSNVTSRDNAGIGVRFFGSHDSSLDVATTDHNQFHGVSVQNSQRVTLSHVTSYANKRSGTRVATGIDVSSGSTDVVVQRSTTYGNDDSGIEAYTGATGTVVRRNLSYDNNDHGIDNAGAPHSTVVSNTVVGNATAGINFEGSSDHPTTRDNVTADNAVGSTRTIGEIRVDESSSVGADLDRDLVFQSSGGPLFEWASQPYTALPAYRTVSNQEPNGINANPAFVALATRDLRLTSRSPGIDAAYTALAAWVPQDLDGTGPVDDPAVTDSGTGPDAVADLGAREFVGTVASGKLTPASGPAPLAVTVDGSASTTLGGGGSIASYSWACGNGTTVTAKTGTCTYATAGTYTAKLTVTDQQGLTDTWSGTVTVATDAPPLVSLSATPASAYVPQDVTLDASGTTDTDGTPVASYAFRCSSTATPVTQPGATYTCSYTKAGTYTVSVTARDTAGLSATKNATVKVLADVAPSAGLTVSSSSIKQGGSVTVSGASSTSVDKSPIATYRFSCGNGVSIPAQTSPTAVCTYPATGNYTVQLWVTDTVGLTGTTTTKVLVKK